MAKAKEEKMVHIISATTVEENGIIKEYNVENDPAEKPPKGMLWHNILGRYVPESMIDVEGWVPISDTVFGEKSQ